MQVPYFSPDKKIQIALERSFVFVLPVAHNSKQNGEQIFMYKVIPNQTIFKLCLMEAMGSMKSLQKQCKKGSNQESQPHLNS